MDMKTAKNLKSGSLVRFAWDTANSWSGQSSEGVVIGKKYVEGRHEAKILGGSKDARYDIVVHWFTVPAGHVTRKGVAVMQNWEIMLVSEHSD